MMPIIRLARFRPVLRALSVAVAVVVACALPVAGQVALSLGTGTSPPSPASPHGITLPDTAKLVVTAATLKGRSGVIAMDLGVTGSNPRTPIAPGLVLNLGPTLFPFDVFVLDPNGSHTRIVPLPFTVPPAVGVFSAFWQAAVVDPSAPYGLRLSNGMEAPIVAGTPTWRKLAPTGTAPPGRSSAGALYDPVGRRMIVSHGSTGVASGVLDDTRAIVLGATPAWQNVNPGGTKPLKRWGNAIVYDPVRQRLLLMGGSVNGYQPASDVHTFSVKTGTPATWSQLAPGGTAPPGRRSHSLVFDPVHDRMIVFGGGTGFSPGQSPLGDAWALDFASSANGTWKKLTPSGTPPAAREMHTAILDGPNQRVIVFGGVGSSSVRFADVWALSLKPGAEAWTKIAPKGTGPTPRHSHTAVHDPANQRMVVYGGNVQTSSPSGEVWALLLARGFERWTQLAPNGSAPPARESHLAVFDPVGRRMIVHTGFTQFPSTPFQDAWALDLP